MEKRVCPNCEYGNHTGDFTFENPCGECGWWEPETGVPVLDMDEMAEYIQNRLIEQGYAVEKDAILYVLEFEEEFMDAKGLIVHDEETK